ncbi:hypothetical protein CVD28_03310 [Bacillus sp. M6-12]|uniref:hypothetical protein n=1 Tax=Bacillus sp. M6-12 TaxID=2054166 RepID=UPI000C77B29C|nr:hypothetical protein [Bacillus sp. M6-12]PLS19458.1 hypothetical protein CVD28_03310 [Bacillus sp. M6-12]
MGRTTEGYLTKLEKKNPLGKWMTEAYSDNKIVEELKKKDFLTDDLKLTRRGQEYVMGVLQEMDSVQRIMVERFILEHHQLNVNISYNEK